MKVISGNRTSSSHFWVCSSPFFEVTLLLACKPRGSNLSETTTPILLRLFDADGQQFNELEYRFPFSQLGLVELEPLMAGCKFESGVKHAHLEVQHSADVVAACRLHNRDCAALLSGPQVVSSSARVFFPLQAAREHLHFLCLVNHTGSEATIRSRLFCGKRSPESMWILPPHGSRFICLATEFPDVLKVEGEDRTQGYLRLSSRGDFFVGAELLERSPGTRDSFNFSAVA